MCRPEGGSPLEYEKLYIWKHGRTANALGYVLPPIKIGDLFVLNSYKDKSYIKMLRFTKEID
jgi:hypothetical protein